MRPTSKTAGQSDQKGKIFSASSLLNRGQVIVYNCSVMKPTLFQIRRTVFALILLVLAGFGGYRIGEREALKNLQNAVNFSTEARNISRATVDMSLFWLVWDKLESNYLLRKDLDPKKMFYGAISGMVSSLGDPYTVFLPPQDNKDTKDDLRGDFEGVGIQIGYREQRLAVIAPLSGTPAEKAGIKANDYILKIIDEKQKIDKETTGLSLPEAVRLIRGPRGSKVTLLIQRDGISDPFSVDLKRETIVVKSAEVKFEEKNGKKVAVLKLSRFGERTNDEWLAAVSEIKNEEAKNNNFAGVVLDLRNNPGGFLQGSVFIASEFLPAGVVVQQDRGSDGKEEYRVDRAGKLLKEPLAVLINGGSASASEIVAGALQETKRAKLIGEKSFGKGTIQEAEDLEGGAGLHITVARWLLPSGKSVDKEGVKPDIEVKIDEKELVKNPDYDPQIQKAIEVLTN